MSSFAFKATKWMLDVATKLIRANVRLHNAGVLQDDMAVLFVVNHFTRLETVLLPYALLKHTGKACWSLGAAELFTGHLGEFLHATGNVSTKDPDRDTIIVNSLLAGDHPWIIFPEGAMIKDKKVVDHRGRFRVYNAARRRPPHTGAAVLALRAEFYRQKLACLMKASRHEHVDAIRQQFKLDSLDGALAKRTVIVPVNITYFPIRASDNVVLRVAKAVSKDLGERAIEELLVEGTVISEDTDIDITLGEPIAVRQCLEAPEYAGLLECGPSDLSDLSDESHSSEARSLFHEAAWRLMLHYMAAIYGLTTVNADHVFATLLRYQRAEKFTEQAYRYRAFLAADRLESLGIYRLHPGMDRAMTCEEPWPAFDDFMKLCIEEGLVTEVEGAYVRNPLNRAPDPEFHKIRRERLVHVIANEVEPLALFTGTVRNVARLPRAELAARVRDALLKEDVALFEQEYAANCILGESKPPEVGRPFLLLPPESTDEAGPRSRRAQPYRAASVAQSATLPLGHADVKGGVVLVHGYMAAPLEVRAMGLHLARNGYAVYGVRLKGHGTSPEDLGRASWEQWYESLECGFAFLKTLTNNVIVGGLSMGGVLALLAAGRRKSGIGAVFTINAPLQLRNYAVRLASSILTLNALVKRISSSTGWEFVQNDPENRHINYLRNPIAGVRELAKVIEVMEDVLPDICAPTLVVQAYRDPVVNPVSGNLIFDKVGTSDKELSVFDRDRHGIINGDGSEEIFDRVVRFLHWAATKRLRPPSVHPCVDAGAVCGDAGAVCGDAGAVCGDAGAVSADARAAPAVTNGHVDVPPADSTSQTDPVHAESAP